MLRFRVLQLLLLLLLLSFSSVSGEAQKSRSRFRQQNTSSTTLECRVFCSVEKLRTPVAELIWKSTEARLNQLNIEVTVYKDGFTRGPYAVLPSIKREQRFQLQKVIGGQEHVPGLSQLVVVEVRSIRERPGMMAVRIESLEPGLNYFWRVVSKVDGRLVAGSAARCQAPVCPADLQPNEKP
jgi:hypothetical protein